MQRRSNIKFNSAGLAGCVSLCCLLFLMIGLAVPLSTSAAYADDINYDSEAMPTNGDTRYETSTVKIDFTRGVTSGVDGNSVTAPSVTPMKDGEGKSRVTIDTKVSVTNSAKYEVYIGSDSEYLRKDGTSDTDRLNPISGNPTYDNIGINEWGYAWAPKDSFNEKTVTYSAMPGTVRGTVFDSNDDLEATNGEDEREYTISFAANFGTGMTSGVYSSKVTLSVISNPTEVAEIKGFDITTMQEMNNKDSQSKNACARAEIGATGQLKDERDGKYYWVTKLRDGNCWMTQNLDLDIKTSGGALGNNSGLQEGVWPDAAKSDYSSAPSIKIYATSTKVVDQKTINTNTPYTASWSLGDYRMNYTNTTVRDSGTNCGNGKADASECTTQTNAAFVAYTTPTSADGRTESHYILGNHYQWTVATANTTNGTASICPKGWKLPTSNSTTASGSFGKLITPGTGNITSVSALVQDPYYFVRGGFVYQNTRLLDNAGNSGYYWSSTPDDSAAYNLNFNGGGSIAPSNTTGQSFGMSVRCIAR